MHRLLLTVALTLGLTSGSVTTFAGNMAATSTYATTGSADRYHHHDNGRHEGAAPGHGGGRSYGKEYHRLMRKADDCRRKAADYRRHAHDARIRADKAMRRHSELMHKAAEQEHRAAAYEQQALRY